MTEANCGICNKPVDISVAKSWDGIPVHEECVLKKLGRNKKLYVCSRCGYEERYDYEVKDCPYCSEPNFGTMECKE